MTTPILMEEALLESVCRSSFSLSTIFFFGFTSAKGSSEYLSTLYCQHDKQLIYQRNTAPWIKHSEHPP